jgi:hypothetical protein
MEVMTMVRLVDIVKTAAFTFDLDEELTIVLYLHNCH